MLESQRRKIEAEFYVTHRLPLSFSKETADLLTVQQDERLTEDIYLKEVRKVKLKSIIDHERIFS